MSEREDIERLARVAHGACSGGSPRFSFEQCSEAGREGWRTIARAVLAAARPPVPDAGAEPVAWASAEEMRAASLIIQKSFYAYVKKRSDDDRLDTPLYTHPAPSRAGLDPETVRACIEVAQSDEEFMGKPTPDHKTLMDNVGPIENVRAACRVTKHSIVRKLTALLPASTEHGDGK